MWTWWDGVNSGSCFSLFLDLNTYQTQREATEEWRTTWKESPGAVACKMKIMAYIKTNIPIIPPVLSRIICSDYRGMSFSYYVRGLQRCRDKLLQHAKWELWKWKKIRGRERSSSFRRSPDQNSYFDNSNNNLLCRAFQGTQGCCTLQKLHSSGGVSNWVSRTCGCNLFWVIRLSLIMNFIFLFWSTAGILDMNI